MIARKGIIPVLIILLLLTACGGGETNSTTSDLTGNKQEATSPAATESQQKSATPAAVDGDQESVSPAAAEGDVGDDTPLEWPTELMGDIPAASGGIITSIDRGDSFYGEGGPDYIIVVSLRGMDLPDCQAYAANLKELGYLYDVTEQQTDTEFLYSGSLESGKAGVTFKYDLEYDIGYVAYNPKLDAESGETGSDQ